MKLLFILFISTVLTFSCATQKIKTVESNNLTAYRNIKYTETQILEHKYYYFKALELEKEDNLSTAIQCYFKCLEIDSLDYPSLRNIAFIHLKIKSYAGIKLYAEKAIFAAKVKNISEVEMLQLLIVYYKKMDNTDKVIELYETINSIDGDNIYLKNDYANFLASIYEHDKSLELFGEIESKKGKNYLTYKGEIKNFILQENYDKAENVINELIKAYPDKIKYELLYADIYMAKGDINKAVDLYVKYSKKYWNLGSLIKIASQYENLGDTINAYKQYQSIINTKDITIQEKYAILNNSIFKLTLNTKLNSKSFKLSEEFINLYPKEYQLRFLIKEILIKHNKLKLAISQLNKLILIDSTNTHLYKQLIFACSKLNLYDEQYKYGNMGYKIAPNEPIFIFVRGQFFMRKDEFKKASEIYEKGISFTMANSAILFEVYKNLGDCYFKLKDFDKVIENCEKALELKPKDALLLNNYSYYLSVANRDLKKAKKQSLIAVSLDPNNPIYLDTYAWVCFKLKEYDNALIIIKKALKLHIKEVAKEDINAEIIEHYADILYKLGNKKEALKKWEEAKTHKGYSDKLDIKIRKNEYIE